MQLNADAVAKRRAKTKAKVSYVERHGTIKEQRDEAQFGANHPP
jgi:hypothetical protein